MERQCAAGFARHFDLPAGDRSIAQNADALIVERMPFAPQIGRLEEREFVFRKQWRVHFESVQIKAGPKSPGHRHRR
jgi:hypothetical protein